MNTALIYSREGIADEELAKKETERARKRKIDDVGTNRSVSSHSSTSVSTISTTPSRSLSPVHAGKNHTGQSQRISNLEIDRKRRRSISSMSYDSHSTYDSRRRDSSSEREYRSIRGEYPHRQTTNRSRRLRSRSSSKMRRDRRSRKDSDDADRSKRRRRASTSPGDRGRVRDNNVSGRTRRTKTPSFSRDRSQVVKNRKSMTPGIASRPSESSHRRGRSSFDRRSSYPDHHMRDGGSMRNGDGDTAADDPTPYRPVPTKERSLSPFSKRLALTQAMNTGH
ncbi:MAG: hypothetical protein Q9163_002512 [Psora crenata]